MKDIDHIKHLKDLMTCYINVGNYAKGKKIKGQEGLKFAEVLAKKVFSHISSVKILFETNRVNLNDGTYLDFIDHSSIAVLTRASLEAYLTFNHIFITPENQKQSIFRYHCWDLAGFIERKDFQALNKDSKKRKEKEKEMIIDKIELIKSLNEFNQLPKKNQAQILKGNWKLSLSWAELAQGANFDKEYFKDIYSYLCSYAHSGRLSVLQIMQSDNKEDQKEFGSLFSVYCLIVISKFLIDYVKLVPELNNKFESYKHEKFLATVWKNIGEGLIKEN